MRISTATRAAAKDTLAALAAENPTFRRFLPPSATPPVDAGEAPPVLAAPTPPNIAPSAPSNGVRAFITKHKRSLVIGGAIAGGVALLMLLRK